MIKKTFISLLSICLGAGLGSCVKDDMSNCQAVHTVTFDPQNGDQLMEVSVKDQQFVGRPSPDPEWVGHFFIGWSRDAAGTQSWDFDNDRATSDMTLYGQWVPVYTVTFDSQGGDEVPEQLIPEGELATEPEAPQRRGYTFISWNTQSDGLGVDWNFSSTPVTEDVTLYAQWKEKPLYLVVFVANGGVPVPPFQYVYAGEFATEPEAPQRNEYIFGGWYREWDWSGTAWDFNSDTIIGNTILYAKWTLQ